VARTATHREFFAVRTVAETLAGFRPARRTGVETVALSGAHGRVPAQPIRAPHDLPGFARATVDGFAVRAADTYGASEGLPSYLDVTGAVLMGRAPEVAVAPGIAVAMPTGGVLPEGADAVVMVEHTQETMPGTIEVVRPVAPGEGLVRADEDARAGAELLPAGRRLRAQDVGLLAAAGATEVRVHARPRVAIVSTGDELVDVDEPIAEYQIRSSNDRAVEASLLRARLARVTRGRLRDDAATMRAELATLLERADVLVLSGGVSMGQFDLVPGVLGELGARRVFHRVRQRPGKPMWFGVGTRGQPIFALPGNPVSVLIGTTRYIVPALRAAAGLAPQPAEYVTLAAPAEAMAELTHFLPVKLSWSTAGAALATPHTTNTSGDFAALAGTDGFVELAPRRGEYAQGAAVRLFRW